MMPPLRTPGPRRGFVVQATHAADPQGKQRRLPIRSIHEASQKARLHCPRCCARAPRPARDRGPRLFILEPSIVIRATKLSLCLTALAFATAATLPPAPPAGRANTSGLRQGETYDSFLVRFAPDSTEHRSAAARQALLDAAGRGLDRKS